MFEGFLEPHMKENAKGSLMHLSIAFFIEGSLYMITSLIIGFVSLTSLYLLLIY